MSKILANQIANYGDNSPIEVKEGLNIPTGKPLQVSGASGTNGQILSSTGSTIQWIDNFSGSYNDLTNLPTIPAAQVNSDWNAVGTVAEILNKPVIPAIPSVNTLSASGGGSLSYNSGNGEFAFTPPDLSGYLTSYTETDPVFSVHPSAGITSAQITLWDTAYNWGDHASAGYLTSLDIEDLGNVDISGGLSDQQVLKWNATNSVWEPANDLVGGAQGVALTDLSVSTASAGTAALSYNNVNGVFTYTPPDLSGYLTSFTESDPVFTASPANDITLTDINQWDTAYGWGNHASAGYLTTEADTLDSVLSRGSLTSRDIITTSKIFYSNNFADLTTLNNVDTSVYHGMFAHVHAEGHGYFAHAGAWTQLLDTGSSLSELADVATTAPNTNDVLTWDGSNWTPSASQAGGDISFNNGDKLRFGSSGSENLQIYTNGTNSFFKQLSGDLKYELADQFIVQKDTGDEPIAIFTADGSVALYYDNAKKFETTAAGATITGALTAGGLTYPTSNGTSGDVLTSDGAGNVVWGAGGGGGANVTISDTAPGSPNNGDLWWESDKGRLKIYYNDTDSQQWVDASPPLAQPNVPVAAGYITLNGTSPTWSGTTGYTVSGAQPGGVGTDYEITLTFPTAYSARTDYIVQTTYDGTNYVSGNGASIGVARGTASVVFTPRRWDENPLSLGEIMVTITNL